MFISRFFAIVILAMLVGCRLGNPVSVDDRSLAERLDERRSAADAPAVAPEVSDTRTIEPEAPDAAPDAIALSTPDPPQISPSQAVVAEIVGSRIGVKLRTGPGPGYDEVLVVPADARVNTTGNITGEWTQIRYGDFEGWVPIRMLRLSESSTGDTIPADGDRFGEPGVVYVVAGTEVGVNIRATADAASELVSGAPVGSEVVSTGRTSDVWVEVEFHDVTGWAFGGYLRPAEDLAVEE